MLGATARDMTKTAGPKPAPFPIKQTTQLPDHPEGWTKKSWDKYLKDHKKRLKRLEREATGDNMNRPPEPDYE